jgi:hypothetical protein
LNEFINERDPVRGRFVLAVPAKTQPSRERLAAPFQRSPVILTKKRPPRKPHGQRKEAKKYSFAQVLKFVYPAGDVSRSPEGLPQVQGLSSAKSGQMPLLWTPRFRPVFK